MMSAREKQLKAEYDRAVFNEIFGRMLVAIGGKTDGDLASYLQITQQSVAGARKRDKIPPAWVVAISEGLNISADWLLYGAGRMERWGAENHRIAEPHTQITGVNNDVVVTVIETPEDLQQSHLSTMEVDDFLFVPLANYHLSEDDGKIVLADQTGLDHAFRREWIAQVASSVNNVVLMPVRGSGMEPSICGGDVVMVDLGRRRITDGAVYAIAAADAIIIKRLYLLSSGKVRIISDNPQWEDEESDPANIKILGQVIWRAGAPGQGRRR